MKDCECKTPMRETNLSDWDKRVRFLPAIGCCYCAGIRGQKILLLGESHYPAGADWNEHKKKHQEPERNFTQWVFRDHFIDKPAGARDNRLFFRTLDGLLAGVYPQEYASPDSAWRHIAFYNYVQFRTDESKRPSRIDWDDSREALAAVCKKLRPTRILVLGKLNWDMISDKQRWLETDIRMSPTDREVWRYRYDEERDALATWVYHPSRSRKDESTKDKATRLRKLIELT